MEKNRYKGLTKADERLKDLTAFAGEPGTSPVKQAYWDHIDTLTTTTANKKGGML